MTKTLADMTAEERQACVGMWADATHCALQGIIFDVSLGHARVLITENLGQYSDEEEYIWVLKNVVPRFDLMRAWNPDGTPPEWDWQYADYTPGMNRGFYSVDESTEKGPELPDGTTRARRLVGEWEEDK